MNRFQVFLFLACLGLTGFTSQTAASVPGRFFEGHFLSGVENGRFLGDRAQNRRLFMFQHPAFARKSNGRLVWSLIACDRSRFRADSGRFLASPFRSLASFGSRSFFEMGGAWAGVSAMFSAFEPRPSPCQGDAFRCQWEYCSPTYATMFFLQSKIPRAWSGKAVGDAK